MYQFQSYERNVDLGDKVRFRNYFTSTSSEDVANFIRRNMKSNPHLYWEITPSVVAKEVTEGIVKKRPGRPKAVTVVEGARQSEERDTQ